MRDPLLWRVLRAWVADAADVIALQLGRRVDRLRLKLARLSARLRG